MDLLLCPSDVLWICGALPVLTSALEAGEWSALRSGWFFSEGRMLGGAQSEKKNFCHSPGRISRPSNLYFVTCDNIFIMELVIT